MTLRITSKAALAAAVAAAGISALALPALSSGHATVSPLQPQGTPLTAARGTYLVRAPNETEAQRTWKLVMHVPPAIQESFSVRQDASWRIRLDRQDTGKTGEGGSKIFAIKRVSWTARGADAEIEPGMFGDWPVRWVNPVAPQRLCFHIAQYYTDEAGSRKNSEIVYWSGDPANAEHPRSCIDVAAAPPKP